MGEKTDEIEKEIDEEPKAVHKLHMLKHLPLEQENQANVQLDKKFTTQASSSSQIDGAYNELQQKRGAQNDTMQLLQLMQMQQNMGGT